jgi:hypothetical protein
MPTCARIVVLALLGALQSTGASLLRGHSSNRRLIDIIRGGTSAVFRTQLGTPRKQLPALKQNALPFMQQQQHAKEQDLAHQHMTLVSSMRSIKAS